jgi:hypothetical protein
MKEVWGKSSKQYCITNETNYNSEDVILEAAYNAINYYDKDERLIITSNSTGEVLFEYDGGSVKWIDGDFARKLFTKYTGR